jgi:plasmid stability protein
VDVATLYVRNIPADLYDDLRRWAAEHDRSVNAEVIDLLEREAVRRRDAADFARSLAAFRRRWKGEYATGKPDAVDLIREDRDRGHKPEFGY